jgi:hypothetical protein
MGDLMVRLTTRLERGETILFLALVMLALPSGASVNAQGALHRAGLVVRFGNGSVTTRCVTFGEPSLTGVDLLARAGLSIVVDVSSSVGAGVCKIGPEGCDRGESCFCQCEGSTCAYWQYFHLQSGAWKYSNVGAGRYQVSDGAVEGWAWGNNVAPPLMPLDQVCAAVSAPGNASPSPTRALEDTPTATPRPTTPIASPTAAPITLPAVSVTSAAIVPALAMPSATSLPTDLPAPQSTRLPSPTETPAPTVAAPLQGVETASRAAWYAIFGVIVLALAVWLVIQLRRKSLG